MFHLDIKDARILDCYSIKVYLSSPSRRLLPKERSVLLPLYALICFTLFVDIVPIYDFDGAANGSVSIQVTVTWFCKKPVLCYNACFN